MDFRLLYEGPLKTNRGAKEKQALRRQFHPQIVELLQRPSFAPVRTMLTTEPAGRPPLRTKISLGPFTFIPVITQKRLRVVDLDITLLTPDEPGVALVRGGDLDNRIKTLFDALRCPRTLDEIPTGDFPTPSESPFFCLLEDDNLIRGIKITTDRLLRPGLDTAHVLLIARVSPAAAFSDLANTWIVDT